MTASDRARAVGGEQPPQFSECELESALVKERVSGPDSLTSEERAIVAALRGYTAAVAA
jgi:hypothetical protein